MTPYSASARAVSEQASQTAIRTVLAIETSCDETALAVVSLEPSPTEQSSRSQVLGAVGAEARPRLCRPQVIAEFISSQIDLHAQYGGVVPELAAREHLRALPTIFEQLVTRVPNLWETIQAIAVTVGPGLKGSLLAGVEFARGLALGRELPLLGVNHIEAHLLSPILEYGVDIFPYLGVIVSGGHTEIIAVRDVGRYELIERTCDDAAGEAFDKCAALLGIPYPGGAVLARYADQYTEKQSYQSEKPSSSRTDLSGSEGGPFSVSWSHQQLSFSGLKTSFRLAVERAGLRCLNRSDLLVSDTHPPEQAFLAACEAAQHAIVATLTKRVARAAECTGITRVGLAGGVAANRALKAALVTISPELYAISPRWSGDNAAMIGAGALLRLQAGCDDRKLSGALHARWPVEEMSL